MSVLVGQIIAAVCDVILEPYVNGDFTQGGGPQLGIITQDELLGMYQVVFTDLLQQCGLIKRPYAFVQRFGIPTYVMPNSANDIEEVFSDQIALFQTDGFDLDRTNPTWQEDVGTPASWHEDRMDMKQFALEPAPELTGTDVYESSGLGGYGVISAIANGTISLTATNDGYGTIGAESGPMALLASGAGFGVPSSIIPVEGNILVIAKAGSHETPVWMTSLMESLPDSFQHYLKYGILAKLFSTDGELKDNQRAIYCNARYLEGVNIAKAITGEMIDQKAQG